APAPAIEACRAALAAGETDYTDSRGLHELRAAISADKEARTGVAVDPERVLVTSGTSPAMLLVFSWLIDPGDEVVIASPHYPCYPNFVRFCGGEPVLVECDPEAGYRLDPDRVRAALTPRTRAVVCASPANPTGAVQDLETLAGLADLGVPLVSDEIYDGLVYDGARAPSALEVPGESFVLDGFSKRYAMTGFRLGYVIAPEEAARSLQVLQQNFFISASEFVQRAGLAALESGAESVRAMRDACAVRRELLVSGLRELGLGVPVAPAGAFYVLADARRWDSDSRRLAFRLLEEAHLAITPGIDFGTAAEGWLRFCYAVPEATLREALDRLGPALERCEGSSA
ncbi:MAG: pyridoxal phosphate-dependent aminotransferase, partial [Myxococcales bacterium]|nr:pyridoxal phosphate-dependent aminotransferase [Myxococcales bacterium]